MVIKPYDIIIIIFTAGIITLFILDTITTNNDSSFVKVEVEGKEYIYPSEDSRTQTFHGLIGDTPIHIEDGSAWVVESDCRNKTCIQMGSISRQGESAACLPNRVLLTIEGEKESEVDVISY